MSLLAVTVGSDPSDVVDAVRAVGWYGVERVSSSCVFWLLL